MSRSARLLDQIASRRDSANRSYQEKIGDFTLTPEEKNNFHRNEPRVAMPEMVEGRSSRAAIIAAVNEVRRNGGYRFSMNADAPALQGALLALSETEGPGGGSPRTPAKPLSDKPVTFGM